VIGVAIIGYGYWGPNLARNFARLPGVQIAAIADPDPARRLAASHDHPSARVEADAASAIAAPAVDAVVIAAPPSEHRALAIAALERGRHVLLEKPPATDLPAARDMVAVAARRGCIFMVDHTFVFAPAVNALAAMVRGGEVGELAFIESTRTNLARFDPAIGVIRDLAVHDLAILDHMLARQPVRIAARGRRSAGGGPEEVALIALDYDNGLLVHLHVNCISPVKIRRMAIGGTRGLAIYDDIEQTEKVRLYLHDRDADKETRGGTALRIGYRTGTVTSPAVAPTEPLARVVEHFVDCVRSGAQPLTGGTFALRVLAAAEAAERSLAAGGIPCTPEAP